MPTFIAEVKTLIASGRKAAEVAKKAHQLVRRIESSEELQERFDEAITDVHREVGQVSRAVCTALVAHALGRDPTTDEVSDFLSAGVNDPSFPHRAFRLLGEARKAASRRRRAFLASMLFGLPFLRLPDDERDRVDMIIERIMVGDVELLRRIDDQSRNAPPPQGGDAAYIFHAARVVALTNGLNVRIATTADHQGEIGFGDPTFSGERFRVDQAAFDALRSLGCIDVSPAKMTQGAWEVHIVQVTPVGLLVAQAIEELRPGFDNASVPETATVES